MIVFFLVMGAVVLAGLCVRLAPADPATWHVLPDWQVDRDLAGGAFRVISANQEDLARLHAIALATPRTRLLAGSVEEPVAEAFGVRRATYETRSLFFGFPDYTTVELQDGRLRIFARLRFGKSDMGVNRKRLDRWLAALK